MAHGASGGDPAFRGVVCHGCVRIGPELEGGGAARAVPWLGLARRATDPGATCRNACLAEPAREDARAGGSGASIAQFFSVTTLALPEAACLLLYAVEFPTKVPARRKRPLSGRRACRAIHQR